MIKFMLVEDEPPILKGIKRTIESIQDHYQVIACAEDGREALKQLEILKPDVLITDVHMPMMDGLELLEEVRVRHPDMICIILSGYREFEYVQQSLRLGVYDYLLKPVSKSAVVKVMAKVEKDLMERETVEVNGFIKSLLYSGQGQESQEVMAIFKAYKGFQVANITIGSFGYDPGNINRHHQLFWEEVNMSEDIYGKCGPGEALWAIQGKNSNVIYLVMASKSPGESIQSYTASKIYLSLKSHQIPVTMTLSDLFDDINRLPEMAASVREKMQNYSVYNRSQLIMKADEVSGLGNNSEDKELLKEITHYIVKGDRQALVDSLDRLVDHWETLGEKQVVIENTLLKIISNLHNHQVIVSRGKPDGFALKVNEIVCQSSDYKELRHKLTELIEVMLVMEAHKTINHHKDHKNLVIQVEKYLRDNHTRKINNKQLSEEFFLSPSYISKIYKDHFGVSTYQYLIQVRIDEAKRILVDHPMMRLKDVSEMVGFRDYHYFCKAFKKETGYSPTEFRMK